LLSKQIEDLKTLLSLSEQETETHRAAVTRVLQEKDEGERDSERRESEMRTRLSVLEALGEKKDGKIEDLENRM
jgi:hypothetical protein